MSDAFRSNYATMRFEPEALHSANNGLHVARNLLEKVKKEFPWISYGDLWTLAGVCALQVRDFVFLLKRSAKRAVGNGRPEDSLETWSY